MNSMTNNFSGPTIVPWLRGTIPPPCFALALHPLPTHTHTCTPPPDSIHPGPHPCVHIPLPHLLSSAALSFITSLCTVRCREEERDGGRDKRKERGLLSAFRWFHMKSQSTHLGCRRRRPASHLLPPSTPELALGCLGASRACTDGDGPIWERVLPETQVCQVVWLHGDPVSAPHPPRLDPFCRKRRVQFGPSVFVHLRFTPSDLSVRCQVATCLCVFKAAVALDSVYSP